MFQLNPIDRNGVPNPFNGKLVGQCDLIGLCLQSLGNKYATKINPSIKWLLGNLEKEGPFW